MKRMILPLLLVLGMGLTTSCEKNELIEPTPINNSVQLYGESKLAYLGDSFVKSENYNYLFEIKSIVYNVKINNGQVECIDNLLDGYYVDDGNEFYYITNKTIHKAY